MVWQLRRVTNPLTSLKTPLQAHVSEHKTDTSSGFDISGDVLPTQAAKLAFSGILG